MKLQDGGFFFRRVNGLLVGRPTEPVELLLAVTLLARGTLALTGYSLTAAAIEPHWLFVFYVSVGFVHLGALLANDGTVRRLCTFTHALVWSGIFLQFAIFSHEITTSFPVLAIFAVWAYLEVGNRMRVPRDPR